MKRWLLLTVLLAALGLLAGCGFGHGAIKGVVIDDAGNSLVGVNVYTDPPTQSTLTDENGYTIRDVPTGVYSIKGSKIGYRTARRDVEVEVDRQVNGDLQLQRTE